MHSLNWYFLKKTKIGVKQKFKIVEFLIQFQIRKSAVCLKTALKH